MTAEDERLSERSCGVPYANGDEEDPPGETIAAWPGLVSRRLPRITGSITSPHMMHLHPENFSKSV